MKSIPSLLKKLSLKNIVYAFEIIFKIGAVLGPRNVTISVNGSCDTHCIMCWYHSPLHGDTKSSFLNYTLSYHTFKSLIQDLKSLGTKNIFITGEGEALLNPDIFKMLELVKQNRMKCSIMLNVNMFDKQTVEKLIDMRIDNIQLSIHFGDLDTFKNIYPLKSGHDFNKVVQALKYFKKYRGGRPGPRLEFINVLLKLNYKNIGAMIKLARLAGANAITFKRALIPLNFREKLDLTPEENSELIGLLTSHAKLDMENNISGFLSSLTHENIDEFFELELNKNQVQPDRKKRTYRFCYVPYTIAIILVDGTVLTCNYDPKAVRPGNINKCSFKEIWFSKKYNQYRKKRKCHHCFAVPNYWLLETIFKFLGR